MPVKSSSVKCLSEAVVQRCSENMQQFYRRTPIPKCDFNKVVKQLYWDHTSTWVLCSKFAAYCQNTFPYKHLWTAASVLSNNFVTVPCNCWERILKMNMNCYSGMVDRGKALNLISSRDHCQRFSSSQISNTLWAGI